MNTTYSQYFSDNCQHQFERWIDYFPSLGNTFISHFIFTCCQETAYNTGHVIDRIKSITTAIFQAIGTAFRNITHLFTHFITSYQHYQNLPSLNQYRQEREWQPLHFAAARGDISRLNSLLSIPQGSQLTSNRTSEDETPLMIAIKYQQKIAARILLANSLKEDLINDHSNLLTLIRTYRLPSLKPLIVKENRKTRGWQPIHFAAIKTDTSTLQQLLESDPSLFDLKTDEGETPLEIAIRHQKITACKTLLSNRHQYLHTNAFSLLKSAVRANNRDFIEFMEYEVDFNILNEQQQNILHYALSRQQLNESTLKALLKTDVNVNQKDSRGNPPLSILYHYHAYNADAFTFFHLLHKKGADFRHASSDGIPSIFKIFGTPLFNRLLFHPAKIYTLKTAQEENILHIATLLCRENIINMLMQIEDFTEDAPDSDGNRSIDYAEAFSRYINEPNEADVIIPLIQRGWYEGKDPNPEPPSGQDFLEKFAKIEKLYKLEASIANGNHSPITPPRNQIRRTDSRT